ncbi:MAG: hypothetical protein AAF004_01940 [Pseudomonadota bacterium]
MNAAPAKPATWFWIVSGLALLWNLLGVAAYLMQVTMTPAAIAALPAAEQALYVTIPAWATAAFAVAVFAGTIGCVALLLRRRVSQLIFVFSLVGIVAHVSYNVLMSDATSVYGPTAMVLPITVLAVGIFLMRFARSVNARHWFH